MKNIFSNLRLEKIKDNLIMVSNRFPVSLLSVVLISVCFFILLHGEFSDILEIDIIRAILSLVMIFFLAIGVDLNSESRNIASAKKYLYQIFPVLFGIFFFYSFNSDIGNFENLVFFFLSLFGIIGFLFFAPYLKNIMFGDGEQKSYYAYFYKIATLILISFILGGVLFGLGAIAIASIESLFGLQSLISDKVYGDWAIISMSIFTPLFALIGIPSKNEFNKAEVDQNKFFGFLIRYVAIPFVIIYFVILYVYSIKVLLSFGDWPKGEVSWMVIGFSILGYITYIFSYIFETKNTLIARFRKYLPYVVVPQVFMLFYAIFLRIAQYDLTINRYFVVVFGIWLLALSLYFIFSKKKYLGIIPALLTLFTIIVSVGPWSVYSLPESRQLSRLQDNLTQAGILSSETIIPLVSYNVVHAKLSGEIYDGIDYLCDFDDCNSIKNLFPDQYSDILVDDKKSTEQPRIKIENRAYSGPSKWTIISGITEKIKVQRYYSSSDAHNLRSISYYMSYQKDHFPINTQGYSKLIKLYSHSGINQDDYATINTLTKKISIYQGGTLSNTLDITEMISTLSQINESGQLTPKQMSFEIDEVKVLLENISIPNPKYDGDNMEFYESSSGYLLIK